VWRLPEAPSASILDMGVARAAGFKSRRRDPSTDVQSSNGRLEVTMVEPRS